MDMVIIIMIVLGIGLFTGRLESDVWRYLLMGTGVYVVLRIIHIVYFDGYLKTESNIPTQAPQYDPPLLEFENGTIVGERIFYMDDDGCLCSPIMNTKWVEDHLSSSGGVWAVNPQHKDSRHILDSYADKVRRELGREPIRAVVSIYGYVEKLHNGYIRGEEMDVVSYRYFYEKK